MSLLETRRGWRVGHQGRDEMYYEEWHEGAWRRIILSGEMLTGRAHHVIYFASPERWREYPDWARPRRDEIIGRVKSEFRPPDYEYHGDGPQSSFPGRMETVNRGGEGTGGAVSQVRVVSRPPARVIVGPRSGRGKVTPAVWLVVFLLLSLSAGTGWLVKSGLSRGETFFPSKFGSQRRSVSRQQEPVTFWISIGLFSVVGMGSLGLAGWILREASRGRP